MDKVVSMLMLMTYSIMDAGARLDRQTLILIADTVRFIIFTNKVRAFLGRPVDILDRQCQNWARCYRCNLMDTDGSCEPMKQEYYVDFRYN